MADVVVMPALGNTVESCLLTSWLVAVGDTVEANTLLAEIETDKSSMEVPVGIAGTVLALLVKEGDDVPVRQPIAVIGAPREQVDPALIVAAADKAAPAEAAPAASAGAAPAGAAPGSAGAAPQPAVPAPQPAEAAPQAPDAAVPVAAVAPEEPSAVGPDVAKPSAAQAPGSAAGAEPGYPPSSPRARARAAGQGIAIGQLVGTGPNGRVIARDVDTAVAAGPGLTIGARGATEFVPGEPGTGIGGRVTRTDVAQAGAVSALGQAVLGADQPQVSTAGQTVAEQAQVVAATPQAVQAGLAPAQAVPAQLEPAQAGQPAAQPAGSAFPGEVAETPLKGVRKIIAARMMDSLANSAQLTYTATAPAARLLALRARLKDSDPSLGLSGVTVGDLVGFAAVRTLAKHPTLNSHLVDDTVRTFAEVHLGMAVDTPRGLLVPTLRHACSLPLRDFSRQSKDLATQAIAGSINPDLLGGATFTVSNLGAFGIESFTPLLNLPQVAILGVDAIVPRAVIAPDGTVTAEPRIGFSLTADHRVIDGADAARYLKDLCAAIADIDLLVLGGAA